MESILDHHSPPPTSGPPPAAAPSKPSKGPRACATCARAKSRCVPGPEGQGKCERCHRLSKPCSSQTPAPPRKRKEPKPTRVAELERRIEDLTAMVRPPQQQLDHHLVPLTSVDTGLSIFPKNELTDTSAFGSTQQPKCGRATLIEPMGHHHHHQHQHQHHHMSHLFPGGGFDSAEQPTTIQYLFHPTTTTTTTESSVPDSSIHNLSPPGNGGNQVSSPPPRIVEEENGQLNSWPEGEEAEELLNEYQKHIAHLFPFAVIPLSMTSRELREERPFLWKSVMVEACHHDGQRQIGLGQRMLREIAVAAFIKAETTLDLLQGVQVLISWFHFNIDKYQTTNLLYLMRSITTTLGFENSDNENNWTSESLERMRAFAGTYYLATISSTTNKNPDHLTPSPYLNKCVNVLKNRMEYETDELLAYLVHAQYITQWTSRAITHHRIQPKTHQHPYALIGNFRQSIRAFSESLPIHIKTNPSIVGHLFVAELLLHEGVIQDAVNSSKRFSHMQQQDGTHIGIAGNGGGASHDDMLDMLRTCASLVKGFLTNRFAQQMGDWPRFVVMSSLDFTYVFLTMLKLMTLRLPGWDLRQVRVDLDFERFVSRQIQDMEYTANRRRKRSERRVSGTTTSSSSHTSPMGGGGGGGESQEGGEEKDPFSKLAEKIRTLKNCVVSIRVKWRGKNGQGPLDLSRVYDPAPMTLTDATQDLMQDLMHDIGNEVWVGDMEIDWTGVVDDSTFVLNDMLFDWGENQPLQDCFQGYQI
ncbi:protein priB [Podospora fimiseda]|uniref:Protein priB n=1 Tax=Podospora fimiseda TaxID=252190 RepID=A0AAN7GZH5_9PEZI|nr:protein priB [Podospora fimiseda]